MTPLRPRVKCTLQIDDSSTIFSRLIKQPAFLAFPAIQMHKIHQSASMRQDEANRRHIDGTEVEECSNMSQRESNDSSSSSVAKDSPKSAAVPPTREPQPQLGEDPNSSPAFPEQSVQVSSNPVTGCPFLYSHKLLGWPCFTGVPCPIYQDRQTIPLWK